jgi:dethiobiotin synthetase/adenosylmethionine--8-amino-7-oxononanoate aminotransferase
MRVRCSYNTIKARSSRSYASNTSSTDISQQQQQHFIFGANTDIGKTVLTAALVRASYEGPKKKSDSSKTTSTTNSTHYIKPLQCGGSDESFIRRYAQGLSSSKTLFNWETPASPHFASRIEDKPVSDEHVLTTMNDYLRELKTSIYSPAAAAAAAASSTTRENSSQSSVWIETAGGVLSPSSSSPNNNDSRHAKNIAGWGWVTQADLYMPFQNQSSVVLVGDGRLGGISTTIASLEALLNRNYIIGGILLIRDTDDDTNDTTTSDQRQLQQQQNYPGGGLLFDNPDKSIISLPKLPPEPEPLNEWFASNDVKEPISSFVHNHLFLYDIDKRESNSNINNKK